MIGHMHAQNAQKTDRRAANFIFSWNELDAGFASFLRLLSLLCFLCIFVAQWFLPD
jgi:hypothetical protein